jgi:hypothetical protein
MQFMDSKAYFLTFLLKLRCYTRIDLIRAQFLPRQAELGGQVRSQASRLGDTQAKQV